MGQLKIGEKVIQIGTVEIDSWLSEIYVEPEFTISIRVYDPEDEESPDVLVFDHLPKQIISQRADLWNRDIHFSHAELNKYGNHIELNGETFEALDLSIRISGHEDGRQISGKGSLQNEKSQEKVMLDFKAQVSIHPTEYIRYISSNYHSKRESMLGILETMSSAEDLVKYKASVPFVHVPLEVLDQWSAAFGSEYKWFYDTYTKAEIESFKRIDDQISSFVAAFQEEDCGLPDVPEVLRNDKWLAVMELCGRAVFLLRSVN